jgi:hypothetical protein
LEISEIHVRSGALIDKIEIHYPTALALRVAPTAAAPAALRAARRREIGQDSDKTRRGIVV